MHYILSRQWKIKNIFRFTELKQLIPEISGTVLSERLDELEKLNLIQKHEDDDTKIRYYLTQKALEFKPIVDKYDNMD